MSQAKRKELLKKNKAHRMWLTDCSVSASHYSLFVSLFICDFKIECTYVYSKMHTVQSLWNHYAHYSATPGMKLLLNVQPVYFLALLSNPVRNTKAIQFNIWMSLFRLRIQELTSSLIGGKYCSLNKSTFPARLRQQIFSKMYSSLYFSHEKDRIAMAGCEY